MKTHRINLTAAEAARLVSRATHVLVPIRPQPECIRLADLAAKCPFAPGDRLLCREPRTMPNWAVRLRYTVKDARPVYVPEITEADALACGFTRDHITGTPFDRTARGMCGFKWRKRAPWAWLIGVKSKKQVAAGELCADADSRMLLEEALAEIASLQERIAALEEENRELESVVTSMVA